MKVRDEQHRILDLPLAGSTTLRFIRAPNENGPDTIMVCHGFGTGDGFNRPEWCGTPLRFPASDIAAVCAALDRLGCEP